MDKQKECFRCHIKKPFSEFYKHPQMTDGIVGKCKECNKIDNVKNWHEKRKEKREYDKNRQRYSITRIFNHRYDGIIRRCEKGGTDGRPYKVTGKEYLSKTEFIEWCYKEENYKKFVEYYKIWVDSNFEPRLRPSIDRINSNKGYTLENMQWLSLSENCSKYNK